MNDAAEEFAARMTTVPINQLAMQKPVINQAIGAQGLINTQRLATVIDRGGFDWMANAPFPPRNL